MRDRFPAFWILQFFTLGFLSLATLFFPTGVLEFGRGQRAPKKVERPSEALYAWVLGLEELPPPNDTVRDFFRDHEHVTHKSEGVWTPHDPSLQDFTRKAAPIGWQASETLNLAWEEVETWLLSCEPAPPVEHQTAIRAWLDAADEIPAPSSELCQWIATQKNTQRPPKELQLMILDAKQNLPISWRLASDQIRLAASCIMAAALFTLFGLLTPSIRRPLARVFVLVFLFWTVALLRSSMGPPEWNLTHGIVHAGFAIGFAMVLTAVKAVPRMTVGWTLWLVIAVWWISVAATAALATHETGSVIAKTDVITATSMVALMGIMNAYYWLIGKSEDPPQDDGGIAQRRPPQLWTIWLVQFLILMASGLFALINPTWMAELFTHANIDYLTTDIVDDSVRVLGAWIMAMALFSYFALGVARDWVWQGTGWIFCIVFSLLAFSTVYNAASGEYTIWVYIYGFQGVLFIPVTMTLLLGKDRWSTANVERARTDDWCLTDLSVCPVAICKSFLFGRRAYYRHGVGIRGHLRVLPYTAGKTTDSPEIPEHAFFVPSQQFPVQMRFANRTRKDDAGLDIRGCGIRLSSGLTSPLDLMFATGSFAPTSSLLDFRKLMRHRNLRRVVRTEKNLREGLAAGMRRAPASFASLSYYHHFVLEWLTPDAELYLVRFRLVPVSDSAAQQGPGRATLLGLPDDEDMQHLWKQARRSDESRNRDYLRQELQNRVENGDPVTFQLEAQFHEPVHGDSLDWYDASIEWDIRTHPWSGLAEVILDQPMTVLEGEGLRIDPSNLPPSLCVPKPDNIADIADPRALAAARHRVASVLGRLRTWRRRPAASLYSACDQAPPNGTTESAS